MEFEIDDKFKIYFEYFEAYFGIDKNKYCQFIIENEIKNRNKDLGLI